MGPPATLGAAASATEAATRILKFMIAVRGLVGGCWVVRHKSREMGRGAQGLYARTTIGFRCQPWGLGTSRQMKDGDAARGSGLGSRES